MPASLPVVHELLGRLYSDAEWEALCNGCGLCCYESRWTDTGWNHTDIPCRYLDEEKRCKVYEQRFDAEQDCVKVTASVVMSGMMPPECGYVEELSRLTDEDHPPEPRRGRRARRKERRHGRR